MFSTYGNARHLEMQATPHLRHRHRAVMALQVIERRGSFDNGDS
jgi:hypothetical protein